MPGYRSSVTKKYACTHTCVRPQRRVGSPFALVTVKFIVIHFPIYSTYHRMDVASKNTTFVYVSSFLDSVCPLCLLKRIDLGIYVPLFEEASPFDQLLRLILINA